MKRIIKLVSALFGILGIFFLHVFSINIFPYPLNRIDVAFVFLWWLVIVKPANQTWWIILSVSFLSELYSSSPFGISTLALIMSLWAGRWLVTNIVTGHSWYIILLSTILVLTAYHAIFLGMLAIHHMLYHVDWNINVPFLFATLIGISISTALMMIVYAVNRLYRRELKPNYISEYGR